MGPSLAAILHPYLVALAAALGAILGSFLNVVIARVPVGRSIVRPRSACPGCGAWIAWYDNVPLLSWVLLRGRCRRCGRAISWRYPLVELLGVAAAVAALERHGPTGAAVAELGYVAALIALTFIDLDTWLLPHALTRPLLVAGLAASALHVTPALSFGRAAKGALAGFAVLSAVAWLGRVALKKEAMGGGDVWLLAALGGWNGVAALLPILLLASVQGSVVGVTLVLAGRGQPGPEPHPDDGTTVEDQAASDGPDGEEAWVPPRNAVPFGPFLVAGALEWLYFADHLARAFPPLGIFR